ncbi:MAG: 30S ribosomal protein S12 methylthiotransferase RimO [Bacilli bacterium]|nr:30S ribosomal protein S12 methylthiotransferase RimO [Bacilli bacterium]
MKKVGIVSLGCAKNLVDSEMILAAFKSNQYTITNNPKDADIIIVNTCGFIEPAKKEAINTILEMARYNKKLIVTGCLVERYEKALKKAIPEVNLWIPFSKYPRFNDYVSSYLKDKKHYHLNSLNRVISTPSNTAYLRIAEGCNNFCSFCAIPYIRGRYRSRKINELVKEATLLAKSGIKEINIIAQDVSYYGRDLKDGSNLVSLLKALEKVKGIKHYRLLYLYPNEITDEFIHFMKTSKKVYPYFDIPLQHASETVLKRMNRKGSHALTYKTLKKIKSEVPNAVFRTTMMVGFPGESNSDFKTLISFIKAFKFDHLGAFTYSKEEGTKAFSLQKQISEKTKLERLTILMNEQKKISYLKNKEHIGETLEGLCVSYDKINHKYTFLTKLNAPDDIDGSVFAVTNKPLRLGEYYRLKVQDAFVYDLLVEILD